MKTPLSALVDFRGFRWRLEPLHRKLRADLDGAQFALASLLREERELAELIRTLDSQFLQDARGMLNAPLEPGSRTRSLNYLVERGKDLEARRQEAAGLRSRITVAREECMTAERRLASLETLRGHAQARFVQEQMRVVAKEADMAWLAGRARNEAATTAGGSAP